MSAGTRAHSRPAAPVALSSASMGSFIGTEGWSIPGSNAAHFATEGIHLERYAIEMDCVEMNSSFYRPHPRQGY